jgi:histo-blood group ABO system transferase
MKICILTIATNKYLQFVEKLYDSIEENFLNGHEISCLLFTDHEVETSDNIKVHYIDHEPWPMPTLKRYNYFVKEKDFILQHDYCFYLDADMRIDNSVGDEILTDGIVATMHPYQSFYPKEQRSYDRNPKSLAYVPFGHEGENYYAGGFNGGTTEEFIKMSEIIADRVNKDLENGVIALWHDESQMNRYLIDNKPSLSLTPSYCWAEEFYENSNYPYEPKIIALKKNHSELRN